MPQKSKVCGHEFDHDGWPTDELCPECYFAEHDTDEAYYHAEALREQAAQEQALWLAQRSE